VKKIIGCLIVTAAFLFPAAAQARDYGYDFVDIEYTVNVDSTVDVVERQTFNYEGTYNKGWRSILHKGTSAITDVKVFNGETGEELKRSFTEPNKTDPDDWGKYHVSKGSDSTDVSWYYNLTDTTHEWIIEYKMHGAISFLGDKDELYWNAIGDDYERPVEKVRVTVRIPEGADKSSLQLASYGGGIYGGVVTENIPDGRTFVFEAERIPSGEFFTIAAGWPKGIVDQMSFWIDWALIHWQWFVAAMILVVAMIFGSVSTKKRTRGRGVIVPQYEPPKGISPAMAGVVLAGMSTSRTWPATIIDLAIKGYLTIEERKKKGWDTPMKIFVIMMSSIIVLLISIPIFEAFNNASSLIFIVPSIMFPLVIIAVIITLVFKMVGASAYVLTRTEKRADDLNDYEKEFLDVVFGNKKTFDTSKHLGLIESNLMSQGMKQTRSTLHKETRENTEAFTKKSFFSFNHEEKGPVSVKQFLKKIGKIYLLLALPLVAFALAIMTESPIFFIVLILVIVNIARKSSIGWSDKGKLLREDILGFKMYLETAEKYRMQNLTPDMFEKYLPYAMIFGVENKWAMAFEGINISEPSWYGSHGAVIGASSVAGGFSPVSFSNSFSSSFSSAFSSSTGTSSSGGSGGGGSSGGGGGGGGGGAS
jgi:uncharacterized membrane protein YgcG